MQGVRPYFGERPGAGARSAVNPHAACDVAGTGNGMTVTSTRARRGKPSIQPRGGLRITAPVPDPTSRSSSVSRARRPPSGRHSTRFSSIRYASISRAWRSSQLLTVRSNMRRAGTSIRGRSLHQCRETGVATRPAETWDTTAFLHLLSPWANCFFSSRLTRPQVNSLNAVRNFEPNLHRDLGEST
jgi:hypothetical protein